MALSTQTKIDIRRHLNVPAAGIPMSNYVAGLRTILTVGQLEQYMLVLQAEEECAITGFPYAALQFYNSPHEGDVVTIVINGGSPIVYTVTLNDQNSALPLQSVAGNVANAVLAANQGVTAASGAILTGDVAPGALPPFGQTTIVSPIALTSFSATVTAAAMSIYIAANGTVYPNPNTLNVKGVPAIYGYVPICNYLEGRMVQSDAFSSFNKADVVEFNRMEMYERQGLYDIWRERLGIFLSVGANPAGNKGMGSGFGITA